MTQGSHRQFRPSRWRRKLSARAGPWWCCANAGGSTRFNDLRRGVPRMSPALPSQRLKDLEAAGVVRRSRGRRALNTS